MANTTWNPSDKLGQTLSNGDLTITTTAIGGVRSTHNHSQGKYYFEITNTIWGSNDSVGIAGAAFNFATATTYTYAAIVAKVNGNINVNGTNTGVTFGARANGDIIGFAVDLDNKLIWCRVAPSGNWNANAAYSPGGTGGVSIASITHLNQHALMATGGSGSSFTANFGDTAFSGAVPAGFTSGFPAPSDPTRTLTTQVALEQWFDIKPQAQVTQIALEQWGSASTTTVQALLTQAALEMWAPSDIGPAPSTGRAKVWNGTAWVIKPVKVWSGSAWVTKPLKVWNGSAWT
jgi:hypothetical protein